MSLSLGRGGDLYTNKTLVNALKNFGHAGENVAEAMLEVDRVDFVPVSEEEYAYLDVPLPIGYGQTTSAPSIIAATLTALDIKKGMRALEVGVGSGYQTALLSKLVGDKGKVFGIEIVPGLVEFAKKNLGKYVLKNIELVIGSGASGYEKAAPYDCIVYSAAVKSIPEDAVKQLKDGGRLIAPVGEFYQTLYLVEKRGDDTRKKELGEVVFVPLM